MDRLVTCRSVLALVVTLGVDSESDRKGPLPVFCSNSRPPKASSNEIDRVLSTKFHVSAEDVHQFREETLGFAKLVTPAETLNVVKTDPTDNRILECAVAAGSDTASRATRTCSAWTASWVSRL